MSAAFFYVHNVGPLFFAALWLGSARWVHLDARGRLRNPRGIRAATVAAVALPLVGTVVWSCVRPGETLAERRERRLLRRIREMELRHADGPPQRRIEPRRAVARATAAEAPRRPRSRTAA